jgi:hypothetical protein
LSEKGSFRISALLLLTQKLNDRYWLVEEVSNNPSPMLAKIFKWALALAQLTTSDPTLRISNIF